MVYSRWVLEVSLEGDRRELESVRYLVYGVVCGLESYVCGCMWVLGTYLS